MKTTRVISASLLALAFVLPAAAQVKNYKEIKTPPLRSVPIPVPKRVTLPNGMLVLLLEDHELPTIEVVARVRTGTRLIPADKAGLGEVFGDVLRTGGT